MSAKALHTSRRAAKAHSEKDFGKSRKPFRPVAAIVAKVARDLWDKSKLKTDVELAYRMQCETRTAQYVLAGACDPSGPALLNLINSDIGVIIVQAMTAQSDAPCWQRFRRQVTISEVRRTHAANEARLRELERAAAD